MRTVVAASAAGTAFEWYDFFIFGSLQAIIAKTFFAQLDPTAGQIAALALFGVGFAFRPLGALIFGRVGDVLGRKAAFLICVSMMGGGDLRHRPVAQLPQIGPIAPMLLIAAAHHPRHGARRPVRRRGDLCRRARAGGPARLLHRLGADLGRLRPGRRR